MSKRNVFKILISLLLLLSSIKFLAASPEQEVNAQSTPLSLITPFYGESQIRSYFDHSTPNYNINYLLLKYNAQTLTGNINFDDCALYFNCYDGHNGYDFDLNYDRVLAAANGVVWWAKYASETCHTCGYGLEVKIKHVVNDQVFSTRYAHLSTLAVEAGQYIYAGQIIGTSGSTGHSTGVHLHFDVSICINSSCDTDEDFRAIDPFGWQPEPGAAVQDDPWALAQNPNGADSWCMWKDGQFVNYCNSSLPSHPIEEPLYGSEILVDDTVDNTMGFLKGYNGNGSITCVGIDPGCPEWWETSNVGNGAHIYRTIMNGLAGNYTLEDNWAKWQPQDFQPGDYEVFVKIPSYIGFDNNTFTWQAHFSMVDSSYHPSVKIVDQHIDTGQNYNPRDKWLSLGIYNLNANSALYVIDVGEGPNLHCPTGAFFDGDYWCRAAVDVVKFVPVIYQVNLPLTCR